MKHWPPVNMEKRKARSPDRGSLLLQEPLSMNEQAILFLMEVLNGFEEPPRSDWPRHAAEEVSFSRWNRSGTTRGHWPLRRQSVSPRSWGYTPRPASRTSSTGSFGSRPKP